MSEEIMLLIMLLIMTYHHNIIAADAAESKEPCVLTLNIWHMPWSVCNTT